MFGTKYKYILEQVEQIDPVKYGRTRNFSDGAVTHLSPYISRGVISTKDVLHSVLKRNLKQYQIEKFVQELAWRDYWQQVWIAKGELINNDLKHTQTDVLHQKMPLGIVNADTGINAIDDAIRSFYETGYLHNHMRMYIAGLTCNIGKSHWKVPAQWMYYYLFDADWASNALSWQWVAGTNSGKKYFANQENINKYFGSNQQTTYLDVDYRQLVKAPVPAELEGTTAPELKTILPAKSTLTINNALPTCIYNFYNLDPKWKTEIKANRILLLEPSHFVQYPVSDNTIDFILRLAENIEGIQIYTGEFVELVKEHQLNSIFFKEHPLNKHYVGTEESRDWMFNVKGYYPSFFAFYKKCMKEIKQ